MANSLDMSLDDIIKTRSRGRGRGRTRQGQRQGRGGNTGFRSGGSGMFPRGPLRVNTRPSTNAIAKPFSRKNNVSWQRGLLEDSLTAAGHSGVGNGTKLYVSNLDRGVTNEDIKELFSEIGQLKRHTLHFDSTGRPSGSAEVVFVKNADALAAVKRYDNVTLDGRKMKIEIIGTSVAMPVSARINVIGGANGRGRRTVVMTQGPGRARPPFAPVNRGTNRLNRGGFNRWRGRVQPRGGGGGGGRGRGRVKKEQPIERSAEELNQELETYHAEAMNTS